MSVIEQTDGLCPSMGAPMTSAPAVRVCLEELLVAMACTGPIALSDSRISLRQPGGSVATFRDNPPKQCGLWGGIREQQWVKALIEPRKIGLEAKQFYSAVNFKSGCLDRSKYIERYVMRESGQ